MNYDMNNILIEEINFGSILRIKLLMIPTLNPLIHASLMRFNVAHPMALIPELNVLIYRIKSANKIIQ